jgi:hypothetical protein
MLGQQIYDNYTQTLVLLPVGPNANVDNTRDTLDSLRCHMASPYHVLIVDNSGKGLGGAVAEGHPATVRRADTPTGTYGALAYHVATSTQFALQNFSFDVMLRLDDDALMIGPGADDQALEAFRDQPKVGTLGSYRFNCVGVPRDFAPPAQELRNELGIRNTLRKPHCRLWLRRVVGMAVRNGYEFGEHCLGAAAFYRRETLEAIARRRLFHVPDLSITNLGEDHLMGLLTRAAGYELADFATGSGPIGIALKGLPAEPEELVRMGKKIIHSIKNHPGKTEREIRDHFRVLRQPAGRPYVA